MIPVLTGGRATAPSRPTSSASAAPTSRPRATTTPTSATSTGCAPSLEALDLRGITLVCQDWGGLIGLRLVAEHDDRFARVVAANTFLPTGDQPPGDGVPRLAEVLADGRPTSRSGASSTAAATTDLAPEVDRRLRRAVPRRPYKAGARQFPMLVPTSPDDPGVRARTGARGTSLEQLEEAVPHRVQRLRPDHGAAPTACSRRTIPGAAGQPHTTIEGGGHFLQEDRGDGAGARRRRLHPSRTGAGTPHERDRRAPSSTTTAHARLATRGNGSMSTRGTTGDDGTLGRVLPTARRRAASVAWALPIGAACVRGARLAVPRAARRDPQRRARRRPDRAHRARHRARSTGRTGSSTSPHGDLGQLPATLAVLLVLSWGWNYFVAPCHRPRRRDRARRRSSRRSSSAASSKSPRLILTVATIGLAQLLTGAALFLPDAVRRPHGRSPGSSRRSRCSFERRRA